MLSVIPALLCIHRIGGLYRGISNRKPVSSRTITTITASSYGFVKSSTQHSFPSSFQVNLVKDGVSNFIVYLSSTTKENLHVRQRTDTSIEHRNFGISAPNALTTMHAAQFVSDEDNYLELSEDNIKLVLREMRESLGTLFGYDEKSREVGITGAIDYDDCDGPVVYIQLSGRFWHPTDMVVDRVESYLRKRIPEITQVLLSENSQIVDDNRLNTFRKI